MLSGRWSSRSFQSQYVGTTWKVRPRVDDRAVLDGILWIMRTGAPWSGLPERYPPRATVHRRVQQWCRDGTLRRIWERLVEDLDRRGKINWEETFIDGSFAMAKKGAPAVGKPSGLRARSGWQTSMLMVIQSGLSSTVRPPRKAPSSTMSARASRAKVGRSGSSAIRRTTSDKLDRQLLRDGGITVIARNRGNAGRALSRRPSRARRRALVPPNREPLGAGAPHPGPYTSTAAIESRGAGARRQA